LITCDKIAPTALPDASTVNFNGDFGSKRAKTLFDNNKFLILLKILLHFPDQIKGLTFLVSLYNDSNSSIRIRNKF